MATEPDLTQLVRLLLAGPVDEPQIDLSADYQTGLFCGLEDRDLQYDPYKACLYGFEQGVERALEWAQGLVADCAVNEKPAESKT